MQNILSEFLTAGLLPIGEDDEKLKLLESAAAELAKEIKATPLLAHRFALVGLDEKVPATDPVHKLVEEAVFDKWQTITNKIGPSPVQVYRAVILRALEVAASETKHLGLAVTLTASAQAAVLAKGKEQAAISLMLARYEEANVKYLTEVWVNTVDLVLPKASGKAKKLLPIKEDLASGLGRAVGPTNKDGQALPTPNPHWPNEGPPWSKEFVGRATEAIHNAIQAASKGLAEDIQETLRDSVQGLAAGIERLAIRDAKSELLWIRTSLYSPSGCCSYRDLDPPDLLLHTVLDTSRAVNPAAPPSVAFFLRELVAVLYNKKVRLVDTLAAIQAKLSALPEAQRLTSDTLGPTGRRGLLHYSIHPSTTEPFEEQTGFKEGYEETLPDLAVRLYRELQIVKILSASS